MTSELGALAKAVDAVCQEADYIRAVLTSLAQSKRAGLANPEAWAAVFDLVDKWASEDGRAVARPETVRCLDCGQILPNPKGEGSDREPARIECGPVHVLHYGSFSAEVSEGVCTIRPAKRGSGGRVSIEGPPVFKDQQKASIDGDI